MVSNIGFIGMSDLINQLDVKVQKHYKSSLEIERLQLINSQAVYVVDYRIETIYFQKGIKDLLGYDYADFRYDNLSDLIHPDDRAVVCHISKATVKNAITFGLDFTDRLYISFRMRHINGQYIYVERTSGIYQTSRHGEVISTFSILRVPPFVKPNSRVPYKWKSNYLRLSDFIKGPIKNEVRILTNREMEVLSLLTQGYDYAFISEELYISKETV